MGARVIAAEGFQLHRTALWKRVVGNRSLEVRLRRRKQLISRNLDASEKPVLSFTFPLFHLTFLRGFPNIARMSVGITR